MATQVLTRKQRGELIASKDVEQINSSTFWVKSQSGKGGYSVTLFQGKWSCDCPDKRYLSIDCKHIHAVIASITPKSRFSLDLWEAPVRPRPSTDGN